MSTTSAISRSISPLALGLFAAGSFFALSALVFLSPFVLSSNAIQNDVYMSNLFLSPPLLAIGGALCLGSWLIAKGLGRLLGWWEAVVLAVVGGGMLAVLYNPVGGHYSSFGPNLVNWPPYLNGPMLGVEVGLGLAVFLAGLLWGQAMARHL
jgi:hypothetical protein